MVTWKNWIKSEFIGKKIQVKTDCIFNCSTEGRIVDVEWSSQEPIFCIQTESGKISKIGAHTNGLQFNFL